MPVTIDVQQANPDVPEWLWTATTGHGWAYSAMTYPTASDATYAGLVVKRDEFHSALEPHEAEFVGNYALRHARDAVGPLWGR